MKKAIAIGNDEFVRLRESGAFYVDKTMFIKEIIDSGTDVSLITRPRRFGKTLNITMLKAYFEKADRDTGALFKDLEIWKQGGRYTVEQGKYPVICLTLKEVKKLDWQGCLSALKNQIISEFRRHSEITSSLSENDNELYQLIWREKATQENYEQAIRLLSSWLEKAYGKKTILLIDEYDTPIQQGYLNGYYNEVIVFMRNMFSAAMKTNASLKKAVLTGVTRVAGESLFSGLNNFKEYPVLERQYGQYFGFTEQEVAELMTYYERGWQMDEIRNWYNGYDFGGHIVYNPWSVLMAAGTTKSYLEPYWVNTSDDSVIKNELAKKSPDIKEDFYTFANGGALLKPLKEDITFSDLRSEGEAVWSFLLYAGYLKAVDIRFDLQKGHTATLMAPNLEVRYALSKHIRLWLEENSGGYGAVNVMLNAMLDGNVDLFEERLQDFVENSFSYFDPAGKKPEKVYHSYILGLLVHLRGDYYVESERESGYGRSDVMIMPKAGEKADVSVILEFKKAKEDAEDALKTAANTAIEQIKSKGYASEARKRGGTSIMCYGIGFAGKRLKIASLVIK